MPHFQHEHPSPNTPAELCDLLCDSSGLTANGTADGYLSKTVFVTITDRIINVPASINLALSEERTFQVQIAPTPAPVGGTEITITSSDPSTVEVLTPTVTVPEGQYSTLVTIRAKASATGSATITASNPGFAAEKCRVDVTASLNVLETFADFTPTATEMVYVQLVSGGHPFPAPAGGVTVNLTSSDPNCVTVAPSITIPQGQIYGIVNLAYGGGGTIPCTATITAQADIFGSDTVPTTVSTPPTKGNLTIQGSYWDSNINADRLGGGLEANAYVQLPTSSHGGVRVQIKTKNPLVTYVAADSTTAGLPVLEVFVPNGQSYVYVYVQSLSPTALGDGDVYASAVDFADGTRAVKVVQPALQIVNLSSSYNKLAADAPFYAQVGIDYPYFGYDYFWQVQNVSPAAGPLTVTFASSSPSVGQLKSSTTTGGTVTAEIPVGYYYTPGTFGGWTGVAFDPLTAGATDVKATAPNCKDPFTPATTTVTVNPATMAVGDAYGYGGQGGGGLQVGISMSS
jgi:hypothetical protein